MEEQDLGVEEPLKQLRIAKRERLKAEQRTEQAKLLLQNTTLHEFLEYYHYISKPFYVQRNRTGFSLINPQDKFYPKRLCEWSDFSQTQRYFFDKAYSVLHPASKPPLRPFDSISYIETAGPKDCVRPFQSETYLQIYEKYAVEQPVTSIIAALAKTPLTLPYKLGNGIIFGVYPNTLGHLNRELEGRQQTEMRPPNTNQQYVYKNDSGLQTPLFVINYQGPYEVSVEDISWGFRDSLSISNIIQRDTVPTDLNQRSAENSEEVIAAVVTQAFDAMINCGLEYTYIITGEAIVFLRVNENEPTTLYYHVSLPNQEADRCHDPILRISRTTIGQVLGFCLMAFQSEQRGDDWQTSAKEQLEKWPISRLFRHPQARERGKAPLGL
ncbi:MAG: hypothetical protein M1834_005445 [Cirrosporium novae-zelandiae]|nr:MAG: hypothetical protein M1834_005445 [Cirrosporium novae-zelandiae]